MTIDTNLTKLRIHICPIGYEIDRIVLAARKLRAERVWLIIEKNPHKEKAGKFIKHVESELKKHKIDTETIGVSRDDLFDNLKVITDIFEQEKENDIYVNVSAGSKIQAIAGMMACMMFKEYSPKPYYVEPENYETTINVPQSSGMKRIISLPDYEIKKPEEKLVNALKIINDSKQINKKTLAEIAIKNKLIDSVNGIVTNGDYAKLEHGIITPLEEIWKFIKVTKIGRKHVIEISPSGEDAVRFLIKTKKQDQKLSKR